VGLDFIRKTAPSFHRALDRRAIDLRTPKLFGRDIPFVARTASADICGEARVEPGEKVILRVIKDKVIAQRDNLVIAECPNPPAEFVTRLQAGAGVGEGEIKSFQPLSKTVEIGFCE
jgi:hypothetical protein